MTHHLGTLNGSRRLQLSTVKALQNTGFRVLHQHHQDVLPGVIERFDIVVVQLDVAQVIRANDSPLNVVDPFERHLS